MITQKIIYSLALCIGFVFFVSNNVFAQEKTAEELKAEQEVLKAEMKSKEATERKAKLEKLKPPKPSGVQSIDDFASDNTKILESTKEINTLVPEMYKRTVGESVDGVTDVTVKKPTEEELIKLEMTIANQIKAVADATSKVSNVSGDVKKASPLAAGKAAKSLNYSKDVLELSGAELQMSLKVVKNLIATLKSAKNY
ncbi:MAG: hypothetical protein UZ09_BCD002000456 [Bacteroidetes bacterium OLB9]|nr:MAG: hypothetical protein UZ09_BCD002000456 [Bacteroidetes bacterium OLB9]